MFQLTNKGRNIMELTQFSNKRQAQKNKILKQKSLKILSLRIGEFKSKSEDFFYTELIAVGILK